MKKNKKEKIYGPPGYDLMKENEKTIKFLIIYGIIFTIVYIGLWIAWIYFKSKGM